MTHAEAESRDRAIWYFFTAQVMPTVSRRQEMYARAARAGAATVISNLDTDCTVWYFYSTYNDSCGSCLEELFYDVVND